MRVRSVLVLPLALLPVTLLMSACGSRAVLAPKAGASLPLRPAAAKTTPDAEALMKPTDQARPKRNDELLRDSEKRTPDRFDLPPPG